MATKPTVKEETKEVPSHYIICDKWKGEVDAQGNFEQLKKVQENIPLEETDIETLNAMTGPLNPFKFIPVQ